jgi:hypothetical protein
MSDYHHVNAVATVTDGVVELTRSLDRAKYPVRLVCLYQSLRTTFGVGALNVSIPHLQSIDEGNEWLSNPLFAAHFSQRCKQFFSDQTGIPVDEFAAKDLSRAGE